jgi:hypothetical protein
MQIKLEIETRDKRVRIHSKSKCKKGSLVTATSPSEVHFVRRPIIHEAKSIDMNRINDKLNRVRSCSKIQCEHKKKKAREK